MEITTSCTTNELNRLDFKTIPNGSFRVSYAAKKSKTVEFFDDLYTYPPDFRVKWDTIDELHEDLFMSYNYRVLNNSFPFMNVLTDFFHNEENETVKNTKYSLNSYLDGYLNKITSTKFYSKKAKKLQTSLQNVPVYTILNGQGEIVLATSTDSINSDTTNIKRTAYDFCGSFDPLVEKNTQLGLFFMSRNDAEVYLKEIAKLDTEGTKMFGLSIHCFGLDFAYRVTREYHPNIDFRFIPDLTEVQALITPRHTSDSNLVFEDSQQQLRFRRRPVNVIPFFSNINKWVSPFSSFLEKTEYFKGVPIYIVKVNSTSNNLIIESYYKTLDILDNTYGQLSKVISLVTGFGNNRIIQGSLQQQAFSPTTKTYIFFEKKAAAEFCQRYGRQIARYDGNHSGLFKKPKIFVHNLEDFLEMCEDTFAKTRIIDPLGNQQNIDFNLQTTSIIPAKQSILDVDNYFQHNKKSPLKKISQFFDFKYRRLSGFIEILLNTN